MPVLSRRLRLRVSLAVSIVLILLLAPLNWLQYERQRRTGMRELEILAAATGAIAATSLESASLTSPGSIGTIGSWRIGWGYGVAIAVSAFGILAIYVRSFVDPTLDVVFLAIGVLCFVYALYVLATSLYAARLSRVKRLVCQKCLHEWSLVPENGE